MSRSIDPPRSGVSVDVGLAGVRIARQARCISAGHLRFAFFNRLSTLLTLKSDASVSHSIECDLACNRNLSDCITTLKEKPVIVAISAGVTDAGETLLTASKMGLCWFHH